MKMTNEERQALIGFINAEIARIQRKEELWDGDRMRIASHRLSLAALTAEPAAQTESDDYCNLKELYHAQEKRLFKLAQRIKGPAFDKYAHTTAQAIDVLEASLIDNTAQQYEALAGWKMVPVEPTWEMLAADGCSKHHEGQECSHHENRKRIWRAMLAAAPKPEV